jgi:hypothetical protein
LAVVRLVLVDAQIAEFAQAGVFDAARAARRTIPKVCHQATNS